MVVTPVQNKALWILEDDRGCQFVYEQTLDHRYQTRYFRSLQDFIQALKADGPKPALIIADLMLSDGNFLEFLTNSESEILVIPFIIVSSVDDIDALRFCFKEGALDYLTKPFKKNELLVKIENVLIGQHKSPDVYTHESVVVDGVEIEGLTTKQTKLVGLFLKEDNRTVTRQSILENVWGKTNVHPKTVDVHLYNLRRKLHGYGLMIRSDGGGRWSLLSDRIKPDKT